MSRIVRARYKSLDEMPEWCRCCEHCINAANYSAQVMPNVFLLDVEAIAYFPAKRCPGCGHEMPREIKAFAVAEGNHVGKFIAVATVHLDEGEYILSARGLING